MKKLLAFIPVLLFMTSCAKWADGSEGNVWMEGKWLIFWLPLIGSAIFFFLCWKGSKSEYIHDDGQGHKTKIADKTPFTKVQWFPFAVALLLLAVGIYLGVTLTER